MLRSLCLSDVLRCRVFAGHCATSEPSRSRPSSPSSSSRQSWAPARKTQRAASASSRLVVLEALVKSTLSLIFTPQLFGACGRTKSVSRVHLCFLPPAAKVLNVVVILNVGGHGGRMVTSVPVLRHVVQQIGLAHETRSASACIEPATSAARCNVSSGVSS